MGYIRVPWLLLSCGFRHDRPERAWNAKSGLRLTGYGPHGTPFGRARVFMLYLAEQAARSGRVIRGTVKDVLAAFGLDWRRKNMEEHIRRVLECTYERTHGGCNCSDGDCLVAGEPIDFIKRSAYCTRTRTFEVELTDAFVEQARESARASMGMVKALARTEQFAALDLYCWYQWKLHNKDHRPVDPFGPRGPFGLAPIANSESKRRSDLVRLHKLIAQLWPDCPFRVRGKRGKRRIEYAPKNQRKAPVELATRAGSSTAEPSARATTLWKRFEALQAKSRAVDELYNELAGLYAQTRAGRASKALPRSPETSNGRSSRDPPS